VASEAPKPAGSAFEVFLAALKLGLTCFGGPIAHLGYFHDEYVDKRKWIDDQAYADMVTFAQSLPGAASSKVGIIVGTHRAGLRGGLAAWLGFTTPSAIILMAFGFAVQAFSSNITNAGWLHGLKIAAVVIVAQAVWGMGTRLAPDKERASIAIASAIGALAVESISWGQVVIIALAGLVGWRLLRKIPVKSGRVSVAAAIPRWLAITSLGVFFGLLIVVPLLREIFSQNHTLAVFDAFYRSGALVFGGGHVVLPLLNAAVVLPGWVSSSQFLAGYGLTQAMPGPLFTFSAYLGVVLNRPPNGLEGGLLALFSLFLPSFLLVYGPLPFWNSLRQRVAFQSALAGINAAVVGILLAALYNPIFTTSVTSIPDFALTIGLGVLLIVWKRPPWNIVLIAAAGGFLISLLGLT
jgi:chromate transporter